MLKISIVTVCYNSSKTILDTINSVNSQVYPDIEHIFVDGLSSDNTVEIIKLKRQNVHYFIKTLANAFKCEGILAQLRQACTSNGRLNELI